MKYDKSEFSTKHLMVESITSLKEIDAILTKALVQQTGQVEAIEKVGQILEKMPKDGKTVKNNQRDIPWEDMELFCNGIRNEHFYENGHLKAELLADLQEFHRRIRMIIALSDYENTKDLDKLLKDVISIKNTVDSNSKPELDLEKDLFKQLTISNKSNDKLPVGLSNIRRAVVGIKAVDIIRRMRTFLANIESASSNKYQLLLILLKIGELSKELPFELKRLDNTTLFANLENARDNIRHNNDRDESKLNKTKHSRAEKLKEVEKALVGEGATKLTQELLTIEKELKKIETTVAGQNNASIFNSKVNQAALAIDVNLTAILEISFENYQKVQNKKVDKKLYIETMTKLLKNDFSALSIDPRYLKTGESTLRANILNVVDANFITSVLNLLERDIPSKPKTEATVTALENLKRLNLSSSQIQELKNLFAKKQTVISSNVKNKSKLKPTGVIEKLAMMEDVIKNEKLSEDTFEQVNKSKDYHDLMNSLVCFLDNVSHIQNLLNKINNIDLFKNKISTWPVDIYEVATLLILTSNLGQDIRDIREKLATGDEFFKGVFADLPHGDIFKLNDTIKTIGNEIMHGDNVPGLIYSQLTTIKSYLDKSQFEKLKNVTQSKIGTIKSFFEKKTEAEDNNAVEDMTGFISRRVPKNKLNKDTTKIVLKKYIVNLFYKYDPHVNSFLDTKFASLKDKVDITNQDLIDKLKHCLLNDSVYNIATNENLDNITNGTKSYISMGMKLHGYILVEDLLRWKIDESQRQQFMDKVINFIVDILREARPLFLNNSGNKPFNVCDKFVHQIEKYKEKMTKNQFEKIIEPFIIDKVKDNNQIKTEDNWYGTFNTLLGVTKKEKVDKQTESSSEDKQTATKAKQIIQNSAIFSKASHDNKDRQSQEQASTLQVKEGLPY